MIPFTIAECVSQASNNRTRGSSAKVSAKRVNNTDLQCMVLDKYAFHVC